MNRNRLAHPGLDALVFDADRNASVWLNQRFGDWSNEQLSALDGQPDDAALPPKPFLRATLKEWRRQLYAVNDDGTEDHIGWSDLSVLFDDFELVTSGAQVQIRKHPIWIHLICCPTPKEVLNIVGDLVSFRARRRCLPAYDEIFGVFTTTNRYRWYFEAQGLLYQTTECRD